MWSVENTPERDRNISRVQFSLIPKRDCPLEICNALQQSERSWLPNFTRQEQGDKLQPLCLTILFKQDAKLLLVFQLWMRMQTPGMLSRLWYYWGKDQTSTLEGKKTKARTVHCEQDSLKYLEGMRQTHIIITALTSLHQLRCSNNRPEFCIS